MRFIFDRNTWQEIYGSIRKNKIRTIITVIGVLWGIFIYIVLAGAAKGMDNGFEEVFQSVAMNSVFVWAGTTSIPHEGFKTGRQLRLTLDDVTLLENRIPELEYIAPFNIRGVFGDSAAIVVNNNKQGQYSIYGFYPEYTKITSKKIFDNGRFINYKDIKDFRKVCVIGERTLKELYDKDEDPVGSFIRINDVFFKVIGVHEFSRFFGFESDGDIYIPFSTYRRLYNTGEFVSIISLAAYDDANVVEVEENIKAVLRKSHRVHPDDERAFNSFNLGEVFNKTMDFSKGISFMSFVVGLATILAGVIGIGNILLISVKERTKELGIRRAMGATPREVRSQIILESVFLTLLAGVIGIILGAGVLALINRLTQDVDFPYTNPTVPIPFVLGALAIMVILGTLIGLIPAQRAVSIRPIEALREE